MGRIKTDHLFRNGTAFLAGCVLIISFLYMLSLASAQSVDVPSKTPTAPDEVEELRLALQSKALSPQDRSVLESKWAAAQSAATQKALPQPDGTQRSAQKQTALAQDTPAPALVKNDRPTGLIQDPPQGAFTRTAVFSTIWVEAWQDTYVQICAGSLASDPSQGVVYLWYENSRKLVAYPVPAKTGLLTILGIEGRLISIQGENGISFTFDLQRLQLLDAAGKEMIINTPTALPAYP